MRAFGVLSLLLALVLVGLVVRQQLTAYRPAAPAAADNAGPAAGGESARQLQRQYQRAIEQSMPASRELPADAR